MIVKRLNKQNLMEFQDLSVGQIYEGENGSIRLKIGIAKGWNNCLVWQEDIKEWWLDVEMDTSPVIPLKSELVILE